MGEVAVPTNPERVVVLNQALTGYVFDLGLPVTATVTANTYLTEGFSPFWEEEAKAQGTTLIPWGDDGFSIEKVLAAEPDVIIGGGLGFPLKLAMDQYAELSEIAPTVLVDKTLDTWDQQYKFLADAFAKPEVYAAADKRYEDRIAEVAAAITPPEGESIVVSISGQEGQERIYPFIESIGLPTILSRVGFTVKPLFAEGNYEPYQAGGDFFEISRENVGATLNTPNLFFVGTLSDREVLPSLKEQPIFSTLPAFTASHAWEFPEWVSRGDFNETMAFLDLIEKQFS